MLYGIQWNHHMCVCVCVNSKATVASSQHSAPLVQHTWHMVHMCANTHTIPHSHTNTHVLTFSNTKQAQQNYTKYSERWREKNIPAVNDVQLHQVQDEMLTLITENKRVLLICGNWTGRCDSLDYSLDPEFLTIKSKITMTLNSFSCQSVEHGNKSFLEEKIELLKQLQINKSEDLISKFLPRSPIMSI